MGSTGWARVSILATLLVGSGLRADPIGASDTEVRLAVSLYNAKWEEQHPHRFDSKDHEEWLLPRSVWTLSSPETDLSLVPSPPLGQLSKYFRADERVHCYTIQRKGQPDRLCLFYIVDRQDWGPTQVEAVKILTAEEEAAFQQPIPDDRRWTVPDEYLRAGGDIAAAADRRDVEFLVHCCWAFPFVKLKYSAVDALGKIGPPASSAVPVLRQILTDRALPFHYPRAGVALAKVDGANSVPLLCATVKADMESVRWGPDVRLLDALGSLGPDAGMAVPLLAQLVEDVPAKNRYCGATRAFEALGKIGPASATALPQIRRWLRTEDAELALRTIAQIGKADDLVQEIITAHTEDTKLKFDTLAVVGTEKAVAGLTDLIRAGCSGGSLYNYVSLAKMYGESATPCLQPLLEWARFGLPDDSPQSAELIAEAVAAMGGDVVPDLIKVLEQPYDAKGLNCRYVAVYALKKMTDPRAREALPLLIEEVRRGWRKHGNPTPLGSAATWGVLAICKMCLGVVQAGNDPGDRIREDLLRILFENDGALKTALRAEEYEIIEGVTKKLQQHGP